MKLSFRIINLRRNVKRRAGYSLLECMLALAMMLVMAGCVTLVMNNARQAAIDTKLIRDVADINRAIQMHRMSGGSLTGLTHPQDVIDRMKYGLGANSDLHMTGASKNLLDPRLAVRLQTSMEASSSDHRAYYNPDQKVFVIATSGAQGIKDFVLDESLALKNFGEDNHKSSLEIAGAKGWVRDFHNLGSAPKAGPPVLAGSIESQNMGANPVDLTSFTPNFNGSSIIQFMIHAGTWMACDSAFKANPTETIQATTASQNPADSPESESREEIYTTSAPLGVSDRPAPEELK